MGAEFVRSNDFSFKLISFSETLINEAIAKALKSAQDQGVSGKDATPFLLSAIAKATEGKSLQTSILLLTKKPLS